MGHKSGFPYSCSVTGSDSVARWHTLKLEVDLNIQVAVKRRLRGPENLPVMMNKFYSIFTISSIFIVLICLIQYSEGKYITLYIKFQQVLSIDFTKMLISRDFVQEEYLLWLSQNTIRCSVTSASITSSSLDF